MLTETEQKQNTILVPAIHSSYGVSVAAVKILMGFQGGFRF